MKNSYILKMAKTVEDTAIYFLVSQFENGGIADLSI